MGALEKPEPPLPDNDWCLSDEDQGWVDILMDLEEGRPPDKRLLAKFLRNPRYVVDQRVREYLADHLEGKTRKRRGRPRTVETIEQIRRDFIVRVVHAQTLLAARRMPRSKRSRNTPSEVALEETSRLLAEKDIQLSESQVLKIVYPRRTSRKSR